MAHVIPSPFLNAFKEKTYVHSSIFNFSETCRAEGTVGHATLRLFALNRAQTPPFPRVTPAALSFHRDRLPIVTGIPPAFTRRPWQHPATIWYVDTAVYRFTNSFFCSNYRISLIRVESNYSRLELNSPVAFLEIHLYSSFPLFLDRLSVDPFVRPIVTIFFMLARPSFRCF